MNQKYLICYNNSINHSVEVMEEFKSLFEEKGIVFSVCDIDNLTSDCDFAFVIGGDGTILKTARFYSKFDIPIFGINLGRLGFLSQASRDNLNLALEQVLKKDYKIENRLMLKAGQYIALNDFVVKGEDCSRTSKFALEIDGKFVCEYLADGIIISTPTGSTAYSMSAGGPIIAPNLDIITIVPICPHTFSARPIVVSANSEIKILPVKNTKYNVSADGQVLFSQDRELFITKANNKAKLALLNQNDFYSIIRNKLNWGTSPVSMK